MTVLHRMKSYLTERGMHRSLTPPGFPLSPFFRYLAIEYLTLILIYDRSFIKQVGMIFRPEVLIRFTSHRSEENAGFILHYQAIRSESRVLKCELTLFAFWQRDYIPIKPYIV